MAIGYTRCSAHHKYDFDMQLSAADMAESSLPNQRQYEESFRDPLDAAIFSDENHARREICYATADLRAAGRIYSSGRLPLAMWRRISRVRPCEWREQGCQQKANARMTRARDWRR
jgi:hypothetical protein